MIEVHDPQSWIFQSFVETIKKIEWIYPISIFLSQQILSGKFSISISDWLTNQNAWKCTLKTKTDIFIKSTPPFLSMVFDRVWDIYHWLSSKICYEISFIKVKACILINLLCSKCCCNRCSKISYIRSWSYQVYDRLSIIFMIEPIWILVPSWNPSSEFQGGTGDPCFKRKYHMTEVKRPISKVINKFYQFYRTGHRPNRKTGFEPISSDLSKLKRPTRMWMKL